MQLGQTVATVWAAIFAVLQIRTAASQLRLAAEDQKKAAEASSASTLASLISEARELQSKSLEDPDLHAIWVGGQESGLTKKQKVELFRGFLIGHYALVYTCKSLNQIPESTWSAMRADMHGFFSAAENLKRWNSLKALYPADFREFVDKQLLHQP